MYYTYIYAFRVCYIRLGCKYIRLHKRKAKWPATLLMMISDDQAATDDDIYRWWLWWWWLEAAWVARWLWRRQTRSHRPAEAAILTHYSGGRDDATIGRYNSVLAILYISVLQHTYGQHWHISLKIAWIIHCSGLNAMIRCFNKTQSRQGATMTIATLSQLPPFVNESHMICYGLP